uniref:Uncharacterized protein n=1 Tax=Corethron hystrix TaxID=216773 RepID=A0A7S1BMD3_9STRA|mmetsp:Transcript_3379/g.6238  ORF Transcript_3379/g.6238 Transcript_3379/m.6238 type:complete len:249 (+) Transcript_3379:224-970(+)
MTLPSAPNGGPLGGSLSIHSDVLNAPIPPTKEGKDGLVSELKSRARLTMASGNYPLAEAFYGKAVEVLSGCEGVKHDLAVLYANRSLARLNQNKKDDAIEDATLSVSHDSLYVKGHWRLGSAYSGAGRYAEAYDAFKCGLEVDPSNKPFEREIDKCRAKMTESKIKKKKSPKAEKTKPTASPSPTSSKSVSQKSRDVSTSAAVDAEDKSLFKKSEPIRGYKIVNGKKNFLFSSRADGGGESFDWGYYT